jgi:adenylate cyclase class 2
MQETEAKFYVRNLQGMEARLLDLGARLIQPRLLETNIRFDLPDARLRSEGRVLRLRSDAEARLTYKGASNKEQGVLSRTEIEFTVGDFEKAGEFLEALGYQPFFHYEKYRTTYLLQPSEGFAMHPRNERTEPSGGFIHIMLDELPYGDFIEIEGETLGAIRAVADMLLLKWDTAIATSYHALFERLRANLPQLDPMYLTFAALNGLKVSVEELSVHAADG